MIKENTGISAGDSGGENGRMWQKNAGKSQADFENAPAVTYDANFHEYTLKKDGKFIRRANTENEIMEYLQKYQPQSIDHALKHEGYTIEFEQATSDDITFSVSLYHYMPTVLELDDMCDEYNSLPCEAWDSDIYGVSSKQAKWLKKKGFEEGETWNTYNGENVLSQVVQGTNLKIDGCGEGDYVLIQIHNGADVRGGYTDAKMFKYRHYQEYFNPCPTVYGDIDGVEVSSEENGYSLKTEDGENVPVKKDSIINLHIIQD